MSPFLSPCRSNGICIGAVLKDSQTRKAQIELMEKTLRLCSELPENSVVVTGWHLPKLELLQNRQEKISAKLVYFLDSVDAQNYQDRGFQFYYLPVMNNENRIASGLDLHTIGGRLLKK